MWTSNDDACAVCGGVKGNLLTGPGDFCRCGARIRRTSRVLEQDVDPGGTMTFDNLTGTSLETKTLAAEFKTVADGSRAQGFMLRGLPGRGKTHLVVALVREAISLGRVAGYFPVTSLISRVQETYSSPYGGETRNAIIGDLSGYEIVVLDDLGKERNTEDVASIVYQVLDGLHTAKRTVMICTNLDTGSLVERYDEAVRSRIKGLCEQAHVKGKDRREDAWTW